MGWVSHSHLDDLFFGSELIRQASLLDVFLNIFLHPVPHSARLSPYLLQDPSQRLWYATWRLKWRKWEWWSRNSELVGQWPRQWGALRLIGCKETSGQAQTQWAQADRSQDLPDQPHVLRTVVPSQLLLQLWVIVRLSHFICSLV